MLHAQTTGFEEDVADAFITGYLDGIRKVKSLLGG